jgi:hypothetical protein
MLSMDNSQMEIIGLIEAGLREESCIWAVHTTDSPSSRTRAYYITPTNGL